MTTTILIIVNVFSALAIIVLALMQTSKGDMGSAFGGGGSQSMFGSRGSANFLSRTTATMCAIFFMSSLSLAYIYAEREEATSVIQESSVIDSSTELPAIDNSLPSIDGETGINDDAPVEDLLNDSEVPELPVIEDVEADISDSPVVPSN